MFYPKLSNHSQKIKIIIKTNKIWHTKYKKQKVSKMRISFKATDEFSLYRQSKSRTTDKNTLNSTGNTPKAKLANQTSRDVIELSSFQLPNPKKEGYEKLEDYDNWAVMALQRLGLKSKDTAQVSSFLNRMIYSDEHIQAILDASNEGKHDAIEQHFDTLDKIVQRLTYLGVEGDRTESYTSYLDSYYQHYKENNLEDLLEGITDDEEDVTVSIGDISSAASDEEKDKEGIKELIEESVPSDAQSVAIDFSVVPGFDKSNAMNMLSFILDRIKDSFETKSDN